MRTQAVQVQKPPTYAPQEPVAYYYPEEGSQQVKRKQKKGFPWKATILSILGVLGVTGLAAFNGKRHMAEQIRKMYKNVAFFSGVEILSNKEAPKDLEEAFSIKDDKKREGAVWSIMGGPLIPDKEKEYQRFQKDRPFYTYTLEKDERKELVKNGLSDGLFITGISRLDDKKGKINWVSNFLQDACVGFGLGGFGFNPIDPDYKDSEKKLKEYKSILNEMTTLNDIQNTPNPEKD